MSKVYNSHSYEDTLKIGEEIAKDLKGTEVIALLVAWVWANSTYHWHCKSLGCADCVSSPTFALVNEYHGKCNIYHFDMYRISSWDDLYSIGFLTI